MSRVQAQKNLHFPYFGQWVLYNGLICFRMLSCAHISFEFKTINQFWIKIEILKQNNNIYDNQQKYDNIYNLKKYCL